MPWERFVLGYHGCDRQTVAAVVSGRQRLKKSENDYDWLGHGLYFWEDSPARALQWAKHQARRKNSRIRKPAVVGAVINLGECLNLIDTEYLEMVRNAFVHLQKASAALDLPLPKNEGRDHKLRKLDCAVFEVLHQLRAQEGLPPFDVVRGFFIEGDELYPGAGIRQQDHIQLCVREEKNIMGYFLPRHVN